METSVVRRAVSISRAFDFPNLKLGWISTIYGLSTPKERKDCREELEGLYGLCEECWCLAGDLT